MLDTKFIRENPEIVKKAVKDKQLAGTVDIDELLDVESRYLDLLRKVETKRALKNELSDGISKVAPEAREKLISEATQVKNDLTELESELKISKESLDKLLLKVPNIPANDVPYGEGEEGNEVIREEGKKPTFDFEPKDHMDLGVGLDIIDTERGTKIAGFRGYFLKNDGVLLHRALMDYALDLIRNKGFDILEVPWMVNRDAFVGTGYFPWGEEDHYTVQDDLSLIGSAEVSLTSYYANEVLEEKDLPVKLAGVSPCFRREIGTYGKDMKGILRTHQFTKVEQVVLVPEGEEVSRDWHEQLLRNAEELLKQLGLSYRVMLMCTGDMGPGQRKKFDIETWFPSQNTYRETHSDSYFLDFQARRLNIKYRAKDGSLKYVSTLNNTLAASPRLMAAVMENYQQKDGSIKVPDVLLPYMRGVKELR
ncbi:MAG: serine--tRNA ligase [Patescibacteria group bacterium]|jgi:seryl-tRNA synthetase